MLLFKHHFHLLCCTQLLKLCWMNNYLCRFETLLVWWKQTQVVAKGCPICASFVARIFENIGSQYSCANFQSRITLLCPYKKKKTQNNKSTKYKSFQHCVWSWRLTGTKIVPVNLQSAKYFLWPLLCPFMAHLLFPFQYFAHVRSKKQMT